MTDIFDLIINQDYNRKDVSDSISDYKSKEVVRLFKRKKITGFIYDVDYIIKSNRVYLRCFFIDENGNTYIILIKNAHPYFYVDLNDVENEDIREDIFNYISGLSLVYSIEEVKITNDKFDEYRAVLKIYTNIPKDVVDLRTKIMQYAKIKLKDEMYQVKIYEATIPYHQRMMIDLDIPIYKKIEIEAEVYNFYEYNNVFMIDVKDFNNSYKVISEDEIPPFRYMVVDIEVYNPYVSVRDDRDIIILIGVGYGVYGKSFKYRQFSIDNYGGSMYEQEESMLKDFNEFVEEFKPDLIAGHNSDIFDLPFIINRMRLHGIKPIWSKDKSEPYFRDNKPREDNEEVDDDFDFISFVKKLKEEIRIKKENENNINIIEEDDEIQLDEEEVKKRSRGFRVVIKGVIIFDTYKVVLSLYPKAPAKLKELAEYFKLREHEERKYVDGSKIYQYWDDLKERALLKEYNIDDIKDTQLVMTVLFEQYYALARYIGMNINDMVGKKYGALNRFYYRKMLFKKNAISFDYYKLRKDEDEKKKYKGAFVFQPKVGFYKNVIVADFKSLYPSIIISYNISPENIVFPDEIKEKELIGDVNLTGIKKYWIRLKNGKEGEAILVHIIKRYEDEEGNERTEVSDYYYLQKESVFVNILKGIIDERFHYKDLYKKETNEKLKMKYYNEQYVRKILMNSLYGIMGSKFSGFYHKEVAETITFLAKLHLLTVGELSKVFDLDIIYGDTDSLFLHYRHSKSLDDTINKMNEFINYVNNNLPVKLDIDKIFVKFAISTDKKKYYGLIKNGDDYEIYVAGYKLVKRNVPLIATELQMKLIKYILENYDGDGVLDKEGIRRIVDDYMYRLENFKVNKEEIAITTKLTKPIRDYADGVVHADAIKHAIIEHQFQYVIGELYSYVIIDKSKVFEYLPKTLQMKKNIDLSLISSRAILLEFLQDIKDIDVSYYKDLIVSSIEEVLKPFNMKYDDLFVESFDIF